MRTDATAAFSQAAADAGIPMPAYPIADGELHRYKTNGDKQPNSWYVLHADGVIAAGAFGCWKRGYSEKWCAKRTKDLTEPERRAFLQRMKQADEQREADQARKTADAQLRATEIWGQSSKPGTHPYLTKKQVTDHGINQRGKSLVVPVRDRGRILHSLQFISADGDKTFLAGGKVAGCYHSIGGKPTDRLLIAEGYATAASLHEATGSAVVVAFNTSNLKRVAKVMREKFPSLQIIICGDNDAQTEGNPGKTKAEDAAREINGLVAIPASGGDFNDIATDQGIEIVRQIIDAAKEPPRANGQDNYTERLSPGGENESFPEPALLPDSLPEVDKFQPDLLPSVLAVRALDVSKTTQAPIDFIAAGFLVALSSLVARHIAIRPKQSDDWEVIPNLWGLGVGRPSAKKTPAFKAVLCFLDRLEDASFEDYEAALEAYQQDQIIHEQRVKANKTEIHSLVKTGNPLEEAKVHSLAETINAADINEPACKRYVANDPTVEKLGEIQKTNSAILLFRDELQGFFAGLERQGQESARAYYLESWSGDRPFKFDRIGRGTVRIPRACVSVLGGIQPGPFGSLMRESQKYSRSNDGLLQRFQVAVWPDLSSEFELIDSEPNAENWREVIGMFERLASLDPASVGANCERGIPFLRFDYEAQEIYSAWLFGHENRLRDKDNELPECLESHFGKYPSLVPSIALILHLAEGNTGPVGTQPLAKAISWARYLESHARRLYAPIIGADFVSARALARKLLDEKLPKHFKIREVYRKGWANLSTPDEARNAVDILEDHDWLYSSDQSTGGRPTTVYFINQRIFEGPM